MGVTLASLTPHTKFVYRGRRGSEKGRGVGREGGISHHHIEGQLRPWILVHGFQKNETQHVSR